MSWTCPVCGASTGDLRWQVPTTGTEQGVDADAFRPSAERFGATVGNVLTCRTCGHSAVETSPDAQAMSRAYTDAVDDVSLREEAGQVETGHRALAAAEQFVEPGRLLDIGCWTGSLLVAGRQRGWQPHGIEPSTWAADRAARRGLNVQVGVLADLPDDAGPFRLVALCDVIEHLEDPSDAIARTLPLLEPEGALLLTLPDAGSATARLLGRRWWSVQPMHLQYFTRPSLGMLLRQHGLDVRLVTTHPKVFSVRYYAERFTGYSPPLARWVVGVVEALSLADRLVAPDLRDRMLVIASRPAGPEGG